MAKAGSLFPSKLELMAYSIVFFDWPGHNGRPKMGSGAPTSDGKEEWLFRFKGIQKEARNALWAATDMANILIASDIAEVAKRQQTTWLVLQLYLNYRSQGKIGGEELELGSKALAEDVLELDYTLAAKRVVAVMRNLMKGDEEEVDEALRMALTWYEASKARERPVGGPVFPTRNRFGPIADEPTAIRGEVFFGPINVQAPIRRFDQSNFPVAAAARKLAEQNLWRIGECKCCSDWDNRGADANYSTEWQCVWARRRQSSGDGSN